MFLEFQINNKPGGFMLRYMPIIVIVFVYNVMALDVTVNPLQNSVGLYEILEIDFLHTGTYSDPITDVVIDIDFVHESGETLKVGGFFFDDNLWKVRVRPTQTGNWTYDYSFAITGDAATGSGSFAVTASDNKGWIKQSSSNPFRFEYMNGEPYYMNGFGICNGVCAKAGAPEPWLCWDTVYALHKWEYDGTEGQIGNDSFFTGHSEAGFNTYRFSNGNCSYQFHDFVDNPNTGAYRFVIHKKLATFTDSLFMDIKKYGFTLIFNPVNNGYGTIWDDALSASALANPARIQYWKDMFKYCIDRWGVYMDVFEFFNEYYPHDDFYHVFTPYIKSIDPYNHPVTTSYRPYNHSSIDPVLDIKTDHPYLNEEATVLDIRFWQEHTNTVLEATSVCPVVWTETGNFSPFTNYHPNRFRVYTWMAFVSQFHMVYWNNSFGEYSESFQGITNQFMGPEVRAFNRIFTDITGDFPINHTSSQQTVSNSSKVRAYKLTSSNEVLVYFYYYADRPHTVSGRYDDSGPILSGLTTTIDVPAAADLAEWIDPSTGNVVSSQSVSSGSQQFTVPDIMIDMVLRVRPSGTGTVDRGSLALNGTADQGIAVYPNPFSTSVGINLVRSASSVVRSGKVEIKVFDIQGSLIRTFPRTTNYEPRTKYTWNATTHPNGIYIIKIKAGNKTYHKRVTLVK
jgi:hypothetical protein